MKQEYSSRHIAYNNRQGDIDNFAKFTLDAISHRELLTNDKQVIHFQATKMFEETNEGGYTCVEVFEWDEANTMDYVPTST